MTYQAHATAASEAESRTPWRVSTPETPAQRHRREVVAVGWLTATSTLAVVASLVAGILLITGTYPTASVTTLIISGIVTMVATREAGMVFMGHRSRPRRGSRRG